MKYRIQFLTANGDSSRSRLHTKEYSLGKALRICERAARLANARIKGLVIITISGHQAIRACAMFQASIVPVSDSMLTGELLQACVADLGATQVANVIGESL